ncbi:hypothetical protein D3C84_1159930 [compost metagenome]
MSYWRGDEGGEHDPAFTPTDCQHIPNINIAPGWDRDCGGLGVRRDGIGGHARRGKALVQKGCVWQGIQVSRHIELDLNVGGQ